MKRFGALLLGFGYVLLLVEVLQLGIAWWNGEIEQFGIGEWLIVGSLPVIAWVWWRYLSPFAPNRGQCQLPDTDRRMRR